MQHVIDPVACVSDGGEVEQVGLTEIDLRAKFSDVLRFAGAEIIDPADQSPRRSTSRASDEPMNPAIPVIRYSAMLRGSFSKTGIVFDPDPVVGLSRERNYCS